MIGPIIRGMILNINLMQKYSENSVTANSSLLSPTGGVKRIPPGTENSMQYGYHENDNNMSNETKRETNYSINNKWNNTRKTVYNCQENGFECEPEKELSGATQWIHAETVGVRFDSSCEDDIEGAEHRGWCIRHAHCDSESHRQEMGQVENNDRYLRQM